MGYIWQKYWIYLEKYMIYLSNIMGYIWKKYEIYWAKYNINILGYIGFKLLDIFGKLWDILVHWIY